MAYIGLKGVGSSSWGSSSNYKYASRFQASSSFDADYIYVSFRNLTGDLNTKLGIYSDSSGSPNALLGYTSTAIPVLGTGGHITGGQLTTSVNIVSGSYYWLAALTDASGGSMWTTVAGGVNNRCSNADTYSDGFADPFGGVTFGDNTQLHIYATDTKLTIDDNVFLSDLARGGAIVESSVGDKYLVIINYFSTTPECISVLKEAIGAINPLEPIDIAPKLAVNGGGAIGWIDAAIDSNDDIHVVSSCAAETTRDVAYAVCNLTTGFGTWEEALNYTELAPNKPGCAISIDASDYPHILAVDVVKQTGSSADNNFYTERTGGSWSTPEQVGVRAVKTDRYTQPHIAVVANGDIETFYHGDFLAVDRATFRRRNGTWGTENNYADQYQVGDFIVTTGDSVYRYGVSYNTDQNIKENNVDTGYDTDTSYSSPNRKLVSASLINDSDRYVFFIDTNEDVHVISNSGSGWVDEGVKQTGTYNRVIVEWAYNNWEGNLNYIFDDGTTVYLDVFDLGGDLSVDVSESITVSDTPTVQHIPNPDVSESITVADTPIVDPILLEISVAETIAVTDTPAVTLPVGELDITETDTVTVSDTPYAYIELEADVADAITVTDTPVVEHIPNPTVSDDVVVADTPTAEITLEISVAESIAVTDTPTVSVEAVIALTISVAESITVTDTPEAYILLDVLVSDGVTVTDTPTVAIGVLPDLDITVSESITVTDSASAVILLDVLTSDAITVTDTPTVFVEAVTALEITMTEGITVSDTPTIDPIELEASTSDSVTVADVVTIEDIPSVSVSDSIIVADVASADIELKVTVAESVVVADSADADIPAQPDLEVTVSETVTVSDSPYISIPIELQANDAVAVSDTPTVAVGAPPDLDVSVSEAVVVADTPNAYILLEVTTSDAVSVADVVSVGHIPNVSTAENVSVTDTSILEVTVDITVTESITVADSADADIPVQPDLDINVSETIAVSDTALAYILLETTTADAVTVTDTPTVGHIPNISVAEPIAVTDTPIADITIDITTAETVAVADSADADIPVIAALDITVSESITVSDAAAIYFLLEASVTDAVSVVDSAIISHIANISVSDPVSLADIASAEILLEVDATENVSITDAPTVEVEAEAGLSISVSESIAVADVATPYLLIEAATQDNVSVTDVPIVFVGYATPLFVQVAEQVTVADVPVTLYIPIDLSVQDAVAVLDVPSIIGGANIGVSEIITVAEAATAYVGVPFGVKVDWLSVVLYIDQEMSRTAYVEQERVYNVER